MKVKNFCKICKSTTVAFTDDMDILYHHCKKCDYIFKDKQHFLSFEEEYKRYATHNNSIEDLGYVNMFEVFLKKALPFCLGNTALDFGCGPGPVLAKILEQKGFEIDIYDPHFAEDKNYLEKKYNLITSTEVFEHLHDPKTTLEELTKRMKNNSTLAIMTLFHPQDELKFKNWWYKKDATHIGFFSHKTMHYLAGMFKLELVYIDDKNTCVLVKR